MPTEFVMLPPQTERTREWGGRLAAAVPELKVVVAENHTHAAQVIAHADAAFGTISPDLLVASGAAALAASAAGGAAGRLLLSGADRPSGRDHEFPRDLQRPHRRACDGVCAGLCTRSAPLHPAAAAARVEEIAAGHRRRAFAGSDGAGCRRRWHRKRSRKARCGLWHCG